MKLSKERIEKCAKMGNNSEDLFVEFVEACGAQVTKSTKEQNIYDKIDYIVRYPDACFTFDVKTRESDQVWFEIKGITGHLGSLYGKQSHFAIYYSDLHTLAFMRAEDVRDYIESTVKKEFSTVNAYNTPYHILYQRKGRKDIITKSSREFLLDNVNSYREYNLNEYLK